MVREGDWKLIVNGSRGICLERLPKIYLANLSDDNPESVNHADAQPELVEQLTRLHEEWVERVTPKPHVKPHSP